MKRIVLFRRHQPRRAAAAFDRRERPRRGPVPHAERLEPRESSLVLADLGFGGALSPAHLQQVPYVDGAHVIGSPEGAHERWLVDTVHRLADKANIGRPDVAVYEGEPNAFSHGAFKNSALVAVSTGLLSR